MGTRSPNMVKHQLSTASPPGPGNPRGSVREDTSTGSAAQPAEYTWETHWKEENKEPATGLTALPGHWGSECFDHPWL